MGLDAPCAFPPHSLRLSLRLETWLPPRQPVLELARAPASQQLLPPLLVRVMVEEWGAAPLLFRVGLQISEGQRTSQIRPHGLHGDHLFTPPPHELIWRTAIL